MKILLLTLLMLSLFKPLPSQVPDSDILSFLTRFSEDPEYQINHVQFPLEVVSPDENSEDLVSEKVEKATWTKMNLFSNSCNWIVFYESQSDSAGKEIGFTLHLAGLENGIDVKYLFVKKNNEYYLYKIEDSST